MKQLLLLLFTLIISCSYAQSKKEIILTLRGRIDSLNQVISANESNYRKSIRNLERVNTDLKNQVDKSTKEIQALTKTNDSIIQLKNQQIKVLSDSLTKIKKRALNVFSLTFKQNTVTIDGKTMTTFFIPQKGDWYVLSDTLMTTVSEFGMVCFYLLNKYEEDFQTECPDNYLILIQDNLGNLDYTYLNTEDFLENTIQGNNYGNIVHWKGNSFHRIFLELGTSGCGSGITCNYYEIRSVNRAITLEKKLTGCSGFSDFYLNREKEVYYKIEKLDPECHYGCASRYIIAAFSMQNDEPIFSRKTKNTYPDFTDIGTDVLLNKIKSKEPNVFK
jgi:hypothetical protein